VLALLLAVLVPALAIVVWGVWAAARSQRRSSRAARVPFELECSRWRSCPPCGSTVAAVVFAGIAVVNAALFGDAPLSWTNEP
jgi:hypothetical protein